MLAWKQSNYHDNAAFSICVNLYSAVIASRGNTDCIVALCVIIGILLIENHTYTWSGVFLGIAIHLKLYPVIYVLAYCLNILEIPISFNNITQSAIRISQISLGILVGFSFPTVWYFHMLVPASFVN
ncbi:hypothetical protein GJ496_003247 [Pomphorhynchus laevis]|nr:hypothetical protein GJ496_003247 [Pomphorhynchus laevis]